MKKYLVLMSIIAVAVALGALTSGIALGKGHVPLGKSQVCHKGQMAINVDAGSLADHVGHGDIQLAACDAVEVYGKGADCSGVVDLDGDDKDDAAVTPVTSAACPGDTF